MEVDSVSSTVAQDGLSAATKKAKTAGESVFNGDDVISINGVNSNSPDNSRDSCDNVERENATKSGLNNGVKTNGVDGSKAVEEDADPIVLDSSTATEADVLEDESKSSAPSVCEVSTNGTSTPRRDEENSNSVDCDTDVKSASSSPPAKEKLLSNDEKKDNGEVEPKSNKAEQPSEEVKEDSNKATDDAKSEVKAALGESPRRSARLSLSHDSSTKEADKENSESAEKSGMPADGTQNQDQATNKGSRIARLMENKEVGDVENMRPMAGLLFSVGLDLARQQIFKDLIRVQTKKQSQNKLTNQEEEQLDKLKSAYELVVAKNDAYVQDTSDCSHCHFKTEGENVMEWHKEFAHNQDCGMYACSFCDFEDRSPGNFFFHMEAEHNRRGRIYMRSPFYSCPLCPFENNSKASMNKHKLKCERQFKLKRNLEPTPTDCDIPLKKVKKQLPKQPMRRPQPAPVPIRPAAPPRPVIQPQRNIPPMPPLHRPPTVQQRNNSNVMQRMPTMTAAVRPQNTRQAPPPVMQPNPGVQHFTIGDGMYTLINNNGQIIMQPAGMPAIPLGQSSMINATALAQSLAVPLSRLQQQQGIAPKAPRPGTVASEIAKRPTVPPPMRPRPPVQNPSTPPQFEICEICGGFVKDRESLRIHFYWAHKVDIHKDIFNQAKAHLTCESCPQRFWTYQGIQRHRLTKHSKTNNQKRYHCQVCGKNDVDNLLDHLQRSHGIGMSALFLQKKCLCCGMMFAQRPSLERHLMHSHADLFRNYPGMKGKGKTEVGANAIAMNRQQQGNMGKSNPVPTGLYENTLGKKMYEPFCSICNISFPNMEAFKMHCSRLHSFRCYRCGESYSSEDMRFKHFQEKHKNEKEPCQICGEKIVIGRPLIRHMKRCHVKECSVVIPRLPAKKFNHYYEKYKSMVLAPSPAPKVMKITGKVGMGKKMGPASVMMKAKVKPAVEEVIVIDEEEEKEATPKKKTPEPSTETPKPAPETSDGPTPGVKEQVMEVDGEQYIIQMQEDVDEQEEAPKKDQEKAAENKESADDSVPAGGKEKTQEGEDLSEGKSESFEKDTSKTDEDPTANAVEILQNMAEEIATSTIPMGTD